MTKSDGRVARLTKRSVDAAAPEAARYVLWDADLKGFGLRVEPSGTKTFVVRYRVGGGRRGTLRQFKIGRYGKLTPDEARDEARSALARAETGQDPQGERAKARASLTVNELCDLYLAEGVATKKASTNSLDIIRINGFIRRRLGGRKLSEVTTRDVDRLMQDIASSKLQAAPLTEDEREQLRRGERLPPGRRVKGGKAAATKTVKILSAMYTFGIGRKLCVENPCDEVKTFADGKRERFLSPTELGRLGDVLADALKAGADPSLVAIVRLLALTGARKNEIARLRWSEVDVERGLLQLEDSKTGRKAIRLGAAALELLSEVSRSGSPWVFPDLRDPSKPVGNLDWFWVGVRARAGLADVRIHDLRHSFASAGVAGGAGLVLIGKLLGHAHVATTSRYAHLGDDPLKAAADKISGSISAALSGRSADIKVVGS